jgi:hypothetical protein
VDVNRFAAAIDAFGLGRGVFKMPIALLRCGH